MYAIKRDGSGWRSVGSALEVNTDEVFSTTAPDTSAQQAAASQQADIKAQLSAIDGRIIRALHDAILELAAAGAALSSDTLKRLQDFETEKEALRAQLKG